MECRKHLDQDDRRKHQEEQTVQVFDRRPVRDLAQHAAAEQETRARSHHPADIDAGRARLAPRHPKKTSTTAEAASAAPMVARIEIGSGMTPAPR